MNGASSGQGGAVPPRTFPPGWATRPQGAHSGLAAACACDVPAGRPRC